jgi:hydrogenase nickel incorporation protein HypA/HybF
MHEMSLCESLVQIIEEQALSQKFTRVKQVWVEVGAFSGVEVSALEFCFDIVCRNTVAANSKLSIILLAGKARCFGCSRTVEINDRYDCCPKCAAEQLVIVGGEEFRLKELEVE